MLSYCIRGCPWIAAHTSWIRGVKRERRLEGHHSLFSLLSLKLTPWPAWIIHPADQPVRPALNPGGVFPAVGLTQLA
jgi:hypothetical protein